MSTPRRPAPRSRLAPITATGRASACTRTRARLAFVRVRPDRYAIRVLLADDDEGFVSSLRTLIDEQSELTVVGSASDGLGAIELADELEPDAVVIDLHMPLLDGVSAVARLRNDHKNLCLIALTGDEAPTLHKAAQEAGADAVLMKSQLIEALVERLNAIRTPT